MIHSSYDYIQLLTWQRFLLLQVAIVYTVFCLYRDFLWCCVLLNGFADFKFQLAHFCQGFHESLFRCLWFEPHFRWNYFFVCFPIYLSFFTLNTDVFAKHNCCFFTFPTLCKLSQQVNFAYKLQSYFEK